MRIASIVLALAACGALAQGEKVVAPVPAKEMQPGYGVVESVTPVRVVPERSAAAGGSTAKDERLRPRYRVAVRLPDGSVQYRDLDRPEFKVGDHVLLTNAGDIVPD
ncbi:MAG TPA: hypothetical protein VLI89_05845 [Burkholderiales bacterium]|nr:hypothetical protein [Burkholderiales bacterium]